MSKNAGPACVTADRWIRWVLLKRKRMTKMKKVMSLMLCRGSNPSDQSLRIKTKKKKSKHHRKLQMNINHRFCPLSTMHHLKYQSLPQLLQQVWCEINTTPRHRTLPPHNKIRIFSEWWLRARSNAPKQKRTPSSPTWKARGHLSLVAMKWWWMKDMRWRIWLAPVPTARYTLQRTTKQKKMSLSRRSRLPSIM